MFVSLGIIFALLAAIIHAIVNVIDSYMVKKYRVKNNAMELNIISSIFLIILFIFLTVVFEVTIPKDNFTLFVYILIGISYYVAAYLYYGSARRKPRALAGG